jgi:hypothetical protein
MMSVHVKKEQTKEYGSLDEKEKVRLFKDRENWKTHVFTVYSRKRNY